jgi:hypothetical protein
MTIELTPSQQAEARAKSIVKVIEIMIAPVVEAIQALQNKLADIERRGVTFEGAFQRAADYRRGSMTVHGGSLWAATCNIKAGEPPPGQNQNWQLAAKAGRDAR